MWALGFVPLVIMYYIYHSQKVKKLENKIKRIEQKQKGNKEMSRLLKELIGKTPTIVGQVFGTDNWEVVDVDEEWVKLRRVNKKGKRKNSNYNALRISKLLNLTESRCVTCN